MAFLEQYQVKKIKEGLIEDASQLGKLYKAKKNKYQTISVDHSLVEDYLTKGWMVDKELKIKTKLIKEKSHSKEFEDDIWCQLYELGYRHLNLDENFKLPFSKDIKDIKQIDVVVIDNDTVFLVECKSSKKPKKAPSYKDEFDLLRLRLDGFKKSISQALGRKVKVKYIFATKNLRISEDSDDLKRLKDTRSFYYNDSTYQYVENLIKHYKNAARYQFLGLVFKNEKINDTPIEIPAIEGSMGKQKYYMFSIEPDLLLKIGFVLHRAKANESEFPTYQRLLVPSRLKGITKFIDDGGYFPNSIIVNFGSEKYSKLKFEFSKGSKDSTSKLGTLKIPNAYAIAYIIDGQHRLYGYANSKYKKNNTIPVVAFNGLDTINQLKLFMDINENQKAVSANLRLDLEEDLFWDSDIAVSRLKALRSSIIKSISNSQSSALFGKISIGEERSVLSFKPFATALMKSGLLPTAKGNKYMPETATASLYDVNNHEHSKEMAKSKKQISSLIVLCYGFVEEHYYEIFDKEKYFIVSDRGTYAFIMLIGSLNNFLSESGKINKKSTPVDRFTAMEKYLSVLLDKIKTITKSEEEKYLSLLGAGADVKWLRFFQSIVNKQFLEYNPLDLIDWKERQDEDLQNEGRNYGEAIEKHIKHTILNNLKTLYDINWELEIGSIKRECVDRASKEQEKNYKDGLGNEEIDWKEMFNITDYKVMIEKHWSKIPTPKSQDFKPFQEIFAIDVELGFNSKSEKLKWISQFNKYRNLWAHAGTKEKRLNKEEVGFLQNIHEFFHL